MDREQLRDLMRDHNPGRDERNLAMLSHLLPFFGFMIPGLNIVIPLGIWLVKRNRSPYLDHHARESLNFQITVVLLAAVWGILKMILVGFMLLPLVPVIIILVLVLMVRAAMKASSGDYYKYPFSIRLVS